MLDTIDQEKRPKWLQQLEGKEVISSAAADERRMLSRYGIWLLAGLCAPDEETPKVDQINAEKGVHDLFRHSSSEDCFVCVSVRSGSFDVHGVPMVRDHGSFAKRRYRRGTGAAENRCILIM